MPVAYVRLYGALNDFLPRSSRQSTLKCVIDARVSVKDLIEAVGVPHPEIDVILVNGEPTTFSRLIGQGDRVAAYPAFALLPIPEGFRVGPLPLLMPRFVADGHLGRLAAYLRLMGFDTVYRNDVTDHELAAISSRDDRVLLTRDVGALKHRAVVRGHWMRSNEPARQLVEVLRRYDLAPLAAPFSRCLRCNSTLLATDKSTISYLLPERTRAYYDDFVRCDSCGRVYWKGSHYERMQRLVRAALAASLRRDD